MDVVKKISSVSSHRAIELRSQWSWVTDVVRPLLEAAIGDLPLVSWSVYAVISPHATLGSRQHQY
ncbi:hypothetical protein BDV41DRAFT_297932 [Aspergillus transmontanensis]|uniref:Uncharacterized protein n=1 Tax=Aspergillus transmontanensis TaxID=1034304 RepID=A0A5N6VW53_9EURO|nr:hypothetical protein BDV41DRAFT_297932 [Aspergillus transmontanensis]